VLLGLPIGKDFDILISVCFNTLNHETLRGVRDGMLRVIDLGVVGLTIGKECQTVKSVCYGTLIFQFKEKREKVQEEKYNLSAHDQDIFSLKHNYQHIISA
jgi:hypothetical protein